MNKIKKKYQIIHMNRVIDGGVELILSELTPLTPDPEEGRDVKSWVNRLDSASIMNPEVSDEGRVMINVFEAIKKYAPPGLFPAFRGPQTQGVAVMPQITVLAIRISLTLSEYRELGSPSLDALLELTLENCTLEPPKIPGKRVKNRKGTVTGDGNA